MDRRSLDQALTKMEFKESMFYRARKIEIYTEIAKLRIDRLTYYDKLAKSLRLQTIDLGFQLMPGSVESSCDHGRGRRTHGVTVERDGSRKP